MTTATGTFTALTLIHHELAWKQPSRPNPVIQQKTHTPPVRTGAYQNHFLTCVTSKLTLPFTAPWCEDIFHRQLFQVTSYSLLFQLHLTSRPQNSKFDKIITSVIDKAKFIWSMVSDIWTVNSLLEIKTGFFLLLNLKKQKSPVLQKCQEFFSSAIFPSLFFLLSSIICCLVIEKRNRLCHESRSSAGGL